MSVAGVAAFTTAYTDSQIRTTVALSALKMAQEVDQQMADLVSQTTAAITESMAEQLESVTSPLDIQA
jgi:hypothetical protein